MTQVNPDNVLQVRNALRQQMETMLPALQDATFATRLIPCGPDPISIDATPMFQHKIDAILKIHWAHYTEIKEAVDRLSEAARDYGYAEDQIRRSFTQSQAAP